MPLVEQLRAEVEQLRGQNLQFASQNAQLASQNAQLASQNADLAARVLELSGLVEALQARAGRDSGTSSQPPSSDPPFEKKTKKRSLRGGSGRKPGKQEGDAGSTLNRVENPDEIVEVDPSRCGDCGADLSGASVRRVQRRQVVEVSPPPPPKVTEYRITTRTCSCCRTSTAGKAPAVASGRVQYGPGVLARAALLLCGHYLPVTRAAAVMRCLLGVAVSTGFLAGVRARAARLLEAGFLPHVRALLRSVGVLHVDETPGRAAGGLEYVHVACTEYLTAMHTGGRSKGDIDAGKVLPGYRGTIVRDGYAGYKHLIDAEHAWCAAHLLRDLKAVHSPDPDGQLWAQAMADTLLDANTEAVTARSDGREALTEATLARIRNSYRGAATKGVTDNQDRDGPLAREALTLARRFHQHEDMVLRFAVDLAVPFTNNLAERDIRPVKVQQRTSGGCWRTLQGLADFAVVASYLSTATKWGQDTLGVLEQLFNGHAWLPPAAEPS